METMETPQKSAKTRMECRFEVDFTSKPLTFQKNPGSGWWFGT
jgi:hypothetical protein